MPIAKSAWRVLSLTILSVALFTTHGFRSAGPEQTPIPAGTEPAAQSAPFDAQEIVRRVQLAYRAEAGGFSGGHSSYEVHAGDRGLTLTPIHRRESESADLDPLVEAAPPPEPSVEEGAPLVLGAAQVRRGETRLHAAAPRGAVQPDGHLAFAHGAMVEHVRNSEAGVEQSWSFATAPPGTGDLAVEIATEGLEYTQTTPQGLHFTDARTGLGFQYGHGTWVDAEGRRTPVLAEYSDGHIALHVPESVLAASAYPAVLDPVISCEMTIDGRLTAADVTVQTNPSIAFNGTNFLLVWQMYRGASENLYGARISATGTLLDPAGFPVSVEPGISKEAKVVSNGTDFYVVWSYLNSADWEIRGTRVSGAGVIWQPGGERISTQHRWLIGARVASNGTDYLATWYAHPEDSGSSYDAYARRISAAGTPVGEVIAIAADPSYDEIAPVVTSNGDDYLVAWDDGRGQELGTRLFRAYATRVSSAGEVLDGTGFPLSNDCLQYSQYVQAASSNGTDSLVVWLDYRSGMRGLFGARVTAAGATTESAALAIRMSSAFNESYVAADSDGTDYFVAWTEFTNDQQRFQIMGSRISASLPGQQAVIDTAPSMLSPPKDHRHPTIARSGTGYLVVWDGAWDDRPAGTRDLYQQWIPGSSPTRIALTGVPSGQQTEQAMASNGDNYLVVWTETTASSISIHGTRVSLDGVLIDAVPLNIATAHRERGTPSVTSNGHDYFVTWMDFRDANWDIFGARVLGSGPGQAAVLDPNGFVISSHSAFQNAPVVASDGTDYLVVWRQDAGGSRGVIYGARVTSASAVVVDTTAIAIATNVAEHYTPHVASNGSDYLVVWAEYRDATSWDILGTRVSGQGTLLDASPIEVHSGSGDQYEPDVASDGTDYLVVWIDGRSNTSNDVYAARVTAEGAPLDPSGIAICNLTSQQISPKVAFDGASYVAAWTDNRWGGWSIYAAQITGGGAVLQPDGFYVANNPAGTLPTVSVASAVGERSMVTYSRDDSPPAQGNRRIRGTFLSP